MSEYETILYKKNGPRATITLNRPDSMNGIVPALSRELYECLNQVAYDPDIRVVLFTGAGRAFCPGADLKAGSSAEKNRREYFHVTTMLHDMSKVTVAGINGACAGAGIGWAAACDLRYATARASFNTAFLGVGISGDMGGPWLMPRIIGSARARELFFMSEKFGAEEAERIGFVNRVFADETFHEDLEAIVDKLSKKAPLAIGEMKKNFVNAENMSLRDYIELETERHSRTGQSEDSREAFKAFVEKREPDFKGR